jgi:hypothetical protein
MGAHVRPRATTSDTKPTTPNRRHFASHTRDELFNGRMVSTLVGLSILYITGLEHIRICITY